MKRILVAEDDIADFRVGAIVNSENPFHPGYGGLTEHLHRLAGPKMMKATHSLYRKPAGTVKITLGYNLPAKLVIHVIAPHAQSDPIGEDRLLAYCYQKCLQRGTLRRLNTVVFPVIGSGHCGFAFDRAASIGLKTIRAYLDEHRFPLRVILTVHDARGYDLSLLSYQILGYFMG